MAKAWQIAVEAPSGSDARGLCDAFWVGGLVTPDACRHLGAGDGWQVGSDSKRFVIVSID
jgi:hypothetical protein